MAWRSLGTIACAALLFGAMASRAEAAVDVTIVTTAGSIVVRLETAKAPNTTRNFLRYVDAKTYDGGEFYRVLGGSSTGPSAQPGVIQGGLGPHSTGVHKPIPLEGTRKTGLHNDSGAISMARTSDPNSATTEFFICVGDDSYLDADKSADGQGYAAFGHVIRGFDVVLKIQHANAVGESLEPPIKIIRIRRVR